MEFFSVLFLNHWLIRRHITVKTSKSFILLYSIIIMLAASKRRSEDDDGEEANHAFNALFGCYCCCGCCCWCCRQYFNRPQNTISLVANHDEVVEASNVEAFNLHLKMRLVLQLLLLLLWRLFESDYIPVFKIRRTSSTLEVYARTKAKLKSAAKTAGRAAMAEGRAGVKTWWPMKLLPYFLGQLRLSLIFHDVSTLKRGLAP